MVISKNVPDVKDRQSEYRDVFIVKYSKPIDKTVICFASTQQLELIIMLEIFQTMQQVSDKLLSRQVTENLKPVDNSIF